MVLWSFRKVLGHRAEMRIHEAFVGECDVRKPFNPSDMALKDTNYSAAKRFKGSPVLLLERG